MLPAGPFGVWVTFVTGERIHEIDVEVCLMVMFHSWSSDQQEESSVNIESVEDVDHRCASIQSRKVFCSAIECHDLVSFSLQILQVTNDLTTISLILSYLPHSLSPIILSKAKTT